MRLKPIISKFVRIILYMFYLTVIVLMIMEIAFRFQVIDFYQKELQVLNPKDELSRKSEKKTLLALGDSFTVQSQSWLHQLRIVLSDHRIINSAITGTSIIEASYIAPGRIEAFNPDVFVYQIYVGNDLFGITHRLNWSDWSWIRNVYWWLSDRIHVLAYINYKLSQFNWTGQVQGKGYHRLIQERFDPQHYADREKIWAQGDPFFIENSVLLTNERDKDLRFLLSSLDDVISKLNRNCKVLLIVIPHKSQVNASYLKHMRAVGFRFHDDFPVGAGAYPFLKGIEDHYSTRASVTIINPLIQLAAADKEHPVYFFNDEHLTASGQQVIKDLILAQLVKP